MNDGTLRRYLVRGLIVAVWLGVAGLLLWLSLRTLDMSRLGQSLRSVTLWAVLLVFGIDLLAVVCKAAKWHLLLRPVQKVGVVKLQAAIYAGGAVSMVLPFRLDEAVRAVSAARLSGLSAVKMAGSMALERLVDVFVLLFFAFLLLALLPLPAWFAASTTWVGLLAGTLVTALAVAHGLRAFRQRKLEKAPAARWETGELSTSGLAVPTRSVILRSGGALAWVSRQVSKLASGSRALGSPHLLGGAMLFSVCEWVLTMQVAGVVASSVGLQHLGLDALLLVTMMLFGSFAMPLAPAGIGTFEYACSITLPALFGLTVQQSVTLSLLMHALLLFPMLAVGTPVIVASGLRISDVRQWRRDTAAAHPVE